MSLKNDKAKDILKKSEKYKPIDISQLDSDIKNMYENTSGKYKEIIENIFNEDVLEYSTSDRPTPPYAKGFLDKPFLQGGIPAREKDLAVFNAILSGNYSTVEIEGGVRGGKDVIGTFSWTRYLQTCPDKMHLALGSSLEHVLKTVLMSDGFGLFYTIPHGVFVRESISGAQRGVYKFMDNFGREKQILFYGNEKETDGNKYQGFTLGSVYVNETLNQHLRGLEQAENRMASVKQPLMIMTQNPRGKAHRFYQQFEKAKLISKRERDRIFDFQNKYRDQFKNLESRLLQDRDTQKTRLQYKFLIDRNVSSYSALPKREQLWLNEKLLEINYEFDKIIRNYTTQDFDTKIIKSDFLYNKSVKKLMAYFEGGNNPNEIFNSYDFAYFHFTVDDNMAMSEMQRNDFKNKRAKGTSVYEQEVEGKRRSTDSAVYTMFTDKNIFGGSVDEFDSRGMQRVIVCDKGLNHPNGIIDCDIDFEKGVVWQLGESLLDFKQSDIENRGLESIYLELLQIIRNRRNRLMPMTILVDPSAIELIKYLRQRNLPVREAVNNVWSIKGDKESSHQLQNKDLIGIPFVQTAIANLKYMVHESCVNTIEQIGSYEAPFDEKSGKEKVKKVNDDLVDPIRYLFNTLIRMGMWEGDMDGGEKENDETRIREDESGQDPQRNLARRVLEAFYGDEYEEDYQREDTGNGFWSASGYGFFDN